MAVQPAEANFNMIYIVRYPTQTFVLNNSRLINANVLEIRSRALSTTVAPPCGQQNSCAVSEAPMCRSRHSFVERKHAVRWLRRSISPGEETKGPETAVFDTRQNETMASFDASFRRCCFRFCSFGARRNYHLDDMLQYSLCSGGRCCCCCSNCRHHVVGGRLLTKHAVGHSIDRSYIAL
jgi:hypothetical protein